MRLTEIQRTALSHWQIRSVRSAKHILRRALLITAGQGHVNRFEIETERLDLVQIFDGAVVGVDREVVPLDCVPIS